MNDWRKNLQLIGQWILIIIALVTGFVSIDRRVTALEAGWEQERKGYNTMITGLRERVDRSEDNMNNRLDRIEGKIDYLIEKSHVHNR